MVWQRQMLALYFPETLEVVSFKFEHIQAPTRTHTSAYTTSTHLTSTYSTSATSAYWTSGAVHLRLLHLSLSQGTLVSAGEAYAAMGHLYSCVCKAPCSNPLRERIIHAACIRVWWRMFPTIQPAARSPSHVPVIDQWIQ